MPAVSVAVLSNIELPITKSQLVIMAITPLIGEPGVPAATAAHWPGMGSDLSTERLPGIAKIGSVVPTSASLNLVWT